MKHPQEQYWDAISGLYRAITRIDSSDFHYGPLLAGERVLHLLPELRAGMKALELGCGEGQNSIWLARQGVKCQAVDISEGQLAFARKDAEKAGVEIDFIHASIEDFTAKPESFDLVTSSHAFEFVAKPFELVRRVATWLKPGGSFVLSTVHPVYNGDWVEAEEEEGESTWGRLLVNYFHPIDDLRDQPEGAGEPIASRAYPVSAWFNAFREAGLRVERLEEPPASATPAYNSDDWQASFDECSAIPTTLILVGKKA